MRGCKKRSSRTSNKRPEDPKSIKKRQCEITITGANAADYDYSQNKDESKWRSLLKTIRDNQKETGSRRKTFQFYQRIEHIVTKHNSRHSKSLSKLGNVMQEMRELLRKCDSLFKCRSPQLHPVIIFWSGINSVLCSQSHCSTSQHHA